MKAASEFIHTALHTAIAYAWWARLEISSKFVIPARPGGPSNRHALLLAWALPPIINGGVYRPTSFLKYGSELGWRMSAISGPVTEDSGEAGRYLLDTIPEAVRIHRLDRPVLRPSWRFSPQLDGGFLNALATAQLAFRIFKDDPPAVVIASGPPFHNFVAAHFIARFFGAKLVLDYRDEWTEGMREFIQLGNVDRIWERKCLRCADAVVSAAQGFLDINLNAFSDLSPEKCHVLHNGWEPDEFESAKRGALHEPVPDARFVLSFVGRSGRFLSPRGFLADMDDVFARRPELRNRISVRFIGTQDEEALALLKDFQRSHPVSMDITAEVPKIEAIRTMMKSSSLLLLNNKENARFLPGKIFEYVATGRRILLHGTGGAMGDIVSELGAGISVAEGDTVALELALTNLITNKLPNPNGAKIKPWLEGHTRRALARRFFDILDGL